MSLHDAYARVTPFELLLPEEGRMDALGEAAMEEARGRGVSAEELSGFLTLGAVEAFVREIAGGEGDATTLHRFGPLSYHGVRFAQAGRPLFVLTTHAARYLVEGAPEGDPEPPAESGYLQLPQHLFWTRAAGESPESVDGIFWSVAPSGAFHALMVTGIRPDRPGLGVVPLPAAPRADAPSWLSLEARASGEDFATDLPGAEIDGLYEIESAGEVFKLLARFFAHLAATPEAVEGNRPSLAAKESDGDAAGPAPSSLEYARVTLGEP
ncbi:MAG: hypothetical protein R3253_12525 [Longimicrobiales bacterium]|nr:hypothetical protein [Longimicrobiales bacterium]